MENHQSTCTLLSLSPELQLQIIGYLTFSTTLNYLSCNHALADLISLTLASPSYSPWRRRRHIYMRSFNMLVVHSRKAELGQVSFISGPPSSLDKVTRFELDTSDLMKDMGLIVPEGREDVREEARRYMATLGSRASGLPFERILDRYMPPFRYGDIFITLQHIFQSPKPYTKLPSLHIPTQSLVSLLESRLPPIKLIQTFVGPSILPDVRSHYLDACTLYKLLTAYLYFTELVPDDIPLLLHEAVLRTNKPTHHDPTLEDIRHELLEYFCLLSVFLFAIEKDEILTGCVIAELLPTDYGPPLTQQAARILSNRLNRWIDSYFAAWGPPMPTEGEKSVLTSEQQRVVDTDIGPGDLIKVMAYAGTGKTKCLVQYAAKRPDKKFLYIAFNKSMAQGGVERFPSNVESKTMHSLAWNALPDIAPGLQSRPGALTAEEIIDFLEIDQAYIKQHCRPINRTASIDQFLHAPAKPKPGSLGTLIRDTLERFYRSPSRQVELRHVLSRAQNLGISRDTVVDLARRVWKAQNSTENIMGSIPHDAYLKMLYLAGRPEREEGDAEILDPKHWEAVDRNIFEGYDGILFDEAQDATPVIADILLRQRPHIGIMLVGDPYQMIYQFMGADNCCFDPYIYPSTKTFYLTHSFRFGKNIAGVANVILKAFEQKVLVSGAAFIKDKVMRDLSDRQQQFIGWRPNDLLSVKPPGDPSHGGSGSFAVIFRKNKNMINSFIEFSLNCQEHKIYLKSSQTFTPSAIFKLLRDAHALFHRNKRSKHPALKQFENWHSLMQHIHSEIQGAEDHALETHHQHLSLIYSLKDRIVRHPPSSFETLLKDCEKSLVRREKDADVVFTTCHQAKGLEWDRVQLADDFQMPFNSRHHLRSSSSAFARSEMNMLYVAATRARKELIVCTQLVDYMISEYGLFRSFLARSPIRIPKQLQFLNHIYQAGLTADVSQAEVTEGIPACVHDLSQIPSKDSNQHQSQPLLTKVMWETTIPYGSFIFKQTSPSRYYTPFFTTRKPLFCYECAVIRLRNGKPAVGPPSEYSTRFVQALGPRAETEEYQLLLAEESQPYPHKYASRHVGQIGSPLEGVEARKVNHWYHSGEYDEEAGRLLKDVGLDFYIPEYSEDSEDAEDKYGINDGDEELWKEVTELVEKAGQY